MKRIFTSLIALTTMIAFTARAEEQEKKVHDYLNLSIGIYTDKEMPNAPESPSLDGTFRRLVKTQWNAQTKTMRFIPRNPGVGTFILKDKKGRVVYEYTLDVRKTDLEKVAREIQGLLSTIEGISIKILNNKVVVDGEIILPSDMKRIHSVVKQYQNQATSLVTLSPIAQNKIALFIERKINNPEIRVSAVNGKFILEGFANSKEERDKAEIVAKMYVPDIIVDEAVSDKKVLERKADVVVNLINIRPPPEGEPPKIIQMVVHYVELEKDYTKSFRFQWTPSIMDNSTVQMTTGGSSSTGGAGATIAGTVSNLLPKLNWAKEHGFARVLQSESVMVEDGQTGTLNSLQKIPYQTAVGIQGTPSTAFEPVGIQAQLTPFIMGQRSDSVKIKMKFGVKSLDGYSTAGPLTSERGVETILHVRSGQSAAVGGLISNDSGTNFNKLPGDAPSNPLFSLYASKDFRRNQSQFVVFVTPIIKSSASAGSDKIKKKFRIDQ
jgi:pilus assembly protein CpaC